MEKRVLISRWIGPTSQPLPIYDEASVSSARQQVRDIGYRLNLSKELVENVALIASELTHNHLSHAKQGYFAVKGVERDGIPGLEVIAADLGPGIRTPGLAIQDGFGTDPHSLRAGLGAVCRIADEVEFDNRIAEGTCIIARKFASGVSSHYQVAIHGRPFPGEVISGDDGVFLPAPSGFVAAVVDGLGHGPEAREASNLTIELIRDKNEMDLGQLVIALNEELSHTRGCAISIVRFNRNDSALEAVSLGDVHSHLYHLKDAHFFTATPLTLGTGQFRKQNIRVERKPATPGSTLVMFTDGLKSRTSLKGQLDILRQPAIAIAEHLIEHDSRPDDDALVLVVRLPSEPL